MQVIVERGRFGSDQLEMVKGKDGEALYEKMTVVDSRGREGKVVKVIDENDDGHGKIKVHIQNEEIDYVTDFEPSEKWNCKNQLRIKELIKSIRK